MAAKNFHSTQGSWKQQMQYPVLEEKYCNYFDYGLDATYSHTALKMGARRSTIRNGPYGGSNMLIYVCIV